MAIFECKNPVNSLNNAFICDARSSARLPYFLREIGAKCPVAGIFDTRNPNILRSFFATATATESGLHFVCSMVCNSSNSMAEI